MGIKVALRHVTTYKYDRPITLSPHTIRLRPAAHARTPILSYSLTVKPAHQYLNWQQDPYGNYLARLVFPKPARELRVVVDLHADLAPINPFDFFIEDYAQSYPFIYDAEVLKELTPYLETLPVGPKLRAIIDELKPMRELMVNYFPVMNRAIHGRVNYTIRMEPGIQEPEETLELASGSCRDSAWLLVQLCRNLGLAARFVSGYLIQLVADEKPLEGPEGPAKDFTDLHAWCEVYVPGAGWVGLDSTSGLMAAEGHIPLACTASPQSAAAISGTIGADPDPENPDAEIDCDFRVEMTVTRIVDAPRVTKPYTDDQWHAIDRLGDRVDAELREFDVRLTMGGEPTFVSIEHRDAEEWNTAALGAHKRDRAMELLKRLRDRWAPGGLLHFGEGKWYPGESLPRWAFNCYWRTDGEPIWNDPALVANESTPSDFDAGDAKRFIELLGETLGLSATHAIPGYEDVWHYLWKERRLPVNVDPLKSRLGDPEERQRLAKIFEQQLGSVVGYALPLRRTAGRPNWESGQWHLRQEHLFLVPGDSPMGLRLPLDSLPWEAEVDKQFLGERDPFAPRGELPSPAEPRIQSAVKPSRNGVHPKPVVDPSVVRTTLCVEARAGRLYIFLPPLKRLEDFLELIDAVERTALALQLPVLIEGYKPPSDHRLGQFSVTPDPGVIEVNIHPAKTWTELKSRMTSLYEEARLARLCTEKFMLDGKHTGTGGGNHIVLGAASPADSPFLRRPDLLRSLVGFWNNHPSLSYLFSGLFVGPTSQHPRLDEARHDSLYEIELACQQLPDRSQRPPAWLVDRAFRHLLADVTGNTHRTEFCIDKLFSPDSAQGRLGLLELRSFEMPPHAQMSLVQQLFLRTLISWFWRKPYTNKLVRWGTELHDRFLLPHFVNQDLGDLLDEMKRAGYAFDPAWFVPHQEFRFPILGEATYRGVNMELRAAIEPWPVLGEESGGGGAVRFVDSSLERVQIRVRGLTDNRHVILCNGRRVPLHPTGTNGEFVAGVRYRAWQPPSCLHPTIPSHAPLSFELLDTWNQRSLGGCVYHVAHPGGRTYDTFPVNALEAESRRINRFVPFGHSSGPIQLPAEEPNPGFPLTLDLRRVGPVRSSPFQWVPDFARVEAVAETVG